MKSLAIGVAALVSGSALFAASVEPGFKSLFDGKTLDGWEGNPKLWSVQDGAITGKTGDTTDTKLKHNTFLVWKGGEIADFELRLQYKIVAGNSGIQYRSKLHPAGEFGPIVGGYQADFEAGKTYSGILYEERGRGILAQRGQKTTVKPEIEVTGKDGKKSKKADVKVTGSLGKTEDIQAKIKDEDWNDYVVIAKGNHLQHFINGVQTVDVTDADPAKAAKSGILALQIHVGPVMTVQFRNLRIKQGGGSAKTDLEKMQGHWRPTEIYANGERLGDEHVQPLKLHITGNKYSIQTKDGDDSGSFQIDDTQKPGRIDVTNRKGDQVPAIYGFTGDGLMRVCYALGGGERPLEFKTLPDSGHVFAIYQRVD